MLTSAAHRVAAPVKRKTMTKFGLTIPAHRCCSSYSQVCNSISQVCSSCSQVCSSRSQVCSSQYWSYNSNSQVLQSYLAGPQFHLAGVAVPASPETMSADRRYNVYPQALQFPSTGVAVLNYKRCSSHQQALQFSLTGVAVPINRRYNTDQQAL